MAKFRTKLVTGAVNASGAGGYTPVPIRISGTVPQATVGVAFSFTPTVTGGSG